MPQQFADFAVHQNDQPVAHAELDWWRDYLAGAPTTLALPVDHPRPAQQGTAGATHVFRLPATTADGLGRLARQLRSSPFMVAMVAYATLINRVSGTDDVLIGTPVGGRTESELDPLIEFFVNTVPVRVDLSGRHDIRRARPEVSLLPLPMPLAWKKPVALHRCAEPAQLSASKYGVTG